MLRCSSFYIMWELALILLRLNAGTVSDKVLSEVVPISLLNQNTHNGIVPALRKYIMRNVEILLIAIAVFAIIYHKGKERIYIYERRIEKQSD